MLIQLYHNKTGWRHTNTEYIAAMFRKFYSYQFQVCFSNCFQQIQSICTDLKKARFISTLRKVGNASIAIVVFKADSNLDDIFAEYAIHHREERQSIKRCIRMDKVNGWVSTQRDTICAEDRWFNICIASSNFTAIHQQKGKYLNEILYQIYVRWEDLSILLHHLKPKLRCHPSKSTVITDVCEMSH